MSKLVARPKTRKEIEDERRRVQLNRFKQYRNGGEGFIKWCEDNVSIEIYENGLPVWRPIRDLSDEPHPVTGRTAKDMWAEQCEIARKALKMKNGVFIYRLIVLCWMRGESKSLIVCLIVLWKFFNFASQKIMLGANSKDQSKFVHYDIMRDIILNSPNLLAIVGEKNIQEKEIRLRNKRGRVVSIIRSVSSFSGILSNITGYTFSEMFDMKNPKFFTQIDGSIRNVPNALGLIDSTVSDKQHILYRLYQSWVKNEDPTIFFSHRQSPKADWRDFWNPNMTGPQLNSYKIKFPETEFAQYFRNTWEAASSKMFTPEIVESLKYIGYRNNLGETAKVLQILGNCETISLNENLPEDEKERRIIDLKHDLIHIEKVYSLKTDYLQPRPINLSELSKLSDLYDTDWAILTGADRADPMKKNIDQGARTILTAVAKGLPGSRSNPMISVTDASSTKYIYFLVHLVHVIHSDLSTIKEVLEELYDMFDGIDSFCTERWGMWDMGSWCEDKNISFEPVVASYDRQRESFSELYTVFRSGRFKAPPVAVKGSKQEDILVEESLLFDHNKDKKFYGSPQKKERYGVQDDVMFSLGWTIYGGRFLTVNEFRSRSANKSFGEFYTNKELIGRY